MFEPTDYHVFVFKYAKIRINSYLPYEFVQMMRPKNRPVPRQIVEVIHDNSHEQVDDLE